VPLVADEFQVAVAGGQCEGDIEKPLALAEGDDTHGTQFVQDRPVAVAFPNQLCRQFRPVFLDLACFEREMSHVILVGRLGIDASLASRIECQVVVDGPASVEFHHVNEPQGAVMRVGFRLLGGHRLPERRPDGKEVDEVLALSVLVNECILAIDDDVHLAVGRIVLEGDPRLGGREGRRYQDARGECDEGEFHGNDPRDGWTGSVAIVERALYLRELSVAMVGCMW